MLRQGSFEPNFVPFESGEPGTLAPAHTRTLPLAIASQTPRHRTAARNRRALRLVGLELLENRALLSGSPTIYTVDSASGANTGTSDSGTLP
jgi:hypothetical protein